MKLLIADDSLITRMQMRGAIEQSEDYKFDIVEASTGADAMRCYESLQPDITLLDHLFPDMTGLEVIKILSKNAEYLPIIMVTGFDDIQLVVDAMRMGVQGYLVKDRLQPDTLLLAIEEALVHVAACQERERKRQSKQLAYMMSCDMRKKVGSVNDVLRLLRHHTADQKKLIEFLCLANKAAEQMRGFSQELLDCAIMNSDSCGI